MRECFRDAGRGQYGSELFRGVSYVGLVGELVVLGIRAWQRLLLPPFASVSERKNVIRGKPRLRARRFKD